MNDRRRALRQGAFLLGEFIDLASCVPLAMPIGLITSLLATLPTHSQQIRSRAEGPAHLPAKGAALARPTNEPPL
jgi:hypothetical protein